MGSPQAKSINNKNLPRPFHVVYKAVFNAAQLLGINVADLSAITGLSQPTLFRLRQAFENKQEREVHPKSYESMLLFLRVFRNLDAIFGGNVDHMKTWLTSFHLTLGNGVPLHALKSTEGLVRVVSYLDAMRAYL